MPISSIVYAKLQLLPRAFFKDSVFYTSFVLLSIIYTMLYYTNDTMYYNLYEMNHECIYYWHLYFPLYALANVSCSTYFLIDQQLCASTSLVISLNYLL